ncbi:hypothetical protein [Mycolicibacterium sp. GESEQ-9]|uniref:hypothetical protein n=1 Tax=Mycolicibacterium sp. GESEQ-9 TaxID=2812656 RepID=UPI001B318BAA|nr:hypothetical protein [Mycolicibacterium sp. GESEQ-9]
MAGPLRRFRMDVRKNATIGDMSWQQTIVVLELASTTRPQFEGGLIGLSVDAAQRIVTKLLQGDSKRGEQRMRQKGEVIPKVAFQLTGAGATFTLSGTSGLVHNTLKPLMSEEIGVGARVDVGGGKKLVIKNCAQFPQPAPPQVTASSAASDDAAFNQALDIGVKMMSLAMQAFPSS